MSLPPNVEPHSFDQEELEFLCSLPREIGKNPDTAESILFKVGKFGAYIESGIERRTVEDWRTGRTMDVDAAMEILRQPKFKTARSAPAPLKEFGALDGAAGPVRVISGRFGPYVTDGETNATLPKGVNPAELDEGAAISLLAAKRAAGPSKRPIKRKKAAPAKKTKVAVGRKKTA